MTKDWALGHQLGRAISLRAQHGRLSTMVDTNNLLSARLQTTQDAMGAIQSVGEEFLATIIAFSGDTAGAEIAEQSARSALSEMFTLLNTTQNTEYVFAGINTAAAPVEEYFSTPASTGKLAVDGAFFAAFGFPQGNPAAEGITATDMQLFLDGPLDTLFDPTGWPTIFSTASDQNLRSSIAPGAEVEASINANELAFGKLAKAFIAFADLGMDQFNQATQAVLIDNAISAVGEAVGELVALRANTGTIQERVTRTNLNLSLQISHLNEQVVSLETVDPYETATRVNNLIYQIEVSYTLTARISQLSLVNRL